MKKQKIMALMMMLSVGLMLTACGTKESTDAPQTQEETTAETETAAPETEEEETEETEITEEETTADETEVAAAPEIIQFTVDVTDNFAADGGRIIGNTSSEQSYSGIVELNVDDALRQKAADEIEVGKTYVFTVEPMMTMSIPPQVLATDFAPATEEDIQQLEEVREKISNFKDCMESYQSMSLEEIIQDANFNYALWTQEEIAEFLTFIEEKGYSDDSDITCFVKQRADLNGSVPGDA